MRKEKYCVICGKKLTKKIGYKQFGNLYICNKCLNKKESY